MFNPFKRRTTPDLRDIEQIIDDIARNGRTKEYAALYPAMSDKHVFVPLDPSTTDKTTLRPRLIEGPDQKTYAPATTLETADLLGSEYVKIGWIEFCEHVAKLAETNGALLQGRNSWIAFDQKRVKHMIKKAKP